MTKVMLSLGITSYVLDADKALVLAQMLAGAERYKNVYRARAEGGSLHYVWEPEPIDSDGMVSMTVIPDNLYRMAKLAGRPEEK